jgi:hypothetical protein
MNRLARSLIRLYPAQWRRRYGAEFEAMLEEVPPGWSAAFELLKGAIRMQFSIPSFPKLALMLSVTGLLAGFAVSYAVAPQYTSTAVLSYVDVLRSNARPADFAVSRNLVLSPTSLSSIIRDPRLKLYPDDLAKIPLDNVIRHMRRDTDISLQNLDARATSFRISFTYSEPLKAKATVQALSTRFVDENTLSQLRRLPKNWIEELSKASKTGRIKEEEMQERPVPRVGIRIEVLDPPSLPTDPFYPNRSMFASTGFVAGFVLAIVIAIFRRRFQPAAPLPASFT